MGGSKPIYVIHPSSRKINIPIDRRKFTSNRYIFNFCRSTSLLFRILRIICWHNNRHLVSYCTNVWVAEKELDSEASEPDWCEDVSSLARLLSLWRHRPFRAPKESSSMISEEASFALVLILIFGLLQNLSVCCTENVELYRLPLSIRVFWSL